MYIGIAAHSGEPNPKAVSAARSFIRLLKERCGLKHRIIVGGYWGLMRIVVDEALSQGFTVVILPPVEEEDTDFPDGAIVVKTGLSFRGRSVVLARTSDALVVLGGGSGCMQEAVTAYTEGRPVYVLIGTGYPTDSMRDWPEYLDDRRLAPIKKYDSIDALVNDLCTEEYRRTSLAKRIYG
ncbi:LOG family protein [Thermogladius sp. 4427co]|uniref:SLOG cluster 4 domain-containing protein n=1 Tax=Thermogladius sp. 4427co TaxID=3450718 RepID=UPI003F7979CF